VTVFDVSYPQQTPVTVTVARQHIALNLQENYRSSTHAAFISMLTHYNGVFFLVGGVYKASEQVCKYVIDFVTL
jgi:hypothetical protein